MNKIDIKNLSKDELRKKLQGFGIEPYRQAQIMSWIYKKGVKSFDGMTDLSEGLRTILKSKFHMNCIKLLDSKRSAVDDTAKYLLALEDGNTIEVVLIPKSARNTICLSSQVGCKFGCTFCASAPFGFIRNLKASEIIDETLFIKNKNPESPITNLVFMGIGEPMDNYDNVLKAIRIFNDKDGFGIGARRITISTCGIIPGIEKLAGENLQVELSVSLHSVKDAIRSKIVPVNKKYPLKDLLSACRNYTEKTNRVITFEYIFIEGVNSSAQDAAELARLLKGMKCKVNTITYNRTPENFKKSSDRDVSTFLDVLKNNSINVTHRRSKGEDIDAGCGQLRISRL